MDPVDQSIAFYTVAVPRVESIRVSGSASNGETLFGFEDELTGRLEALGQISVNAFEALFASQDIFGPPIDRNPTTAEYFDLFNADPEEYNKNRPADDPDPKLYDFRLNRGELQKYRRNGFVISGRLGAHSFTEIYYQIFTDDFPAIITSDSILHAWHRSYVAILAEIEEGYLAWQLERILSGMRDALSTSFSAWAGGPLERSALDADYYLAVALSLLSPEPVDPLFAPADEVAETLAAIQALQLREFDLFDRSEWSNQPSLIDFSQFTVRGHYTTSPVLSRYFRAAMWCGRIDFRVAGPDNLASPRELGAALVLLDLLKTAGQLSNWENFDQVIATFVGDSDSMNFSQLEVLLESSEIDSLDDITDLGQLESLQNQIEAGDLGFQNILSHPYFADPTAQDSLVLPRSFTVFGQKFVLDSWAMSHLVFDRILWRDPNDPGVDRPVQRRLPSALDVAFSVLGNDHAGPMIVDRILDEGGVAFRDGLPYQHNLAALRQVTDSIHQSAWMRNMYSGWLASLRQLSNPVNQARFPPVMRTESWAMKLLNTQVSSWTQLRHDTVLYAKQSVSPPILCSFPYTYVEPYPAFWRALGDLAELSANLLARLEVAGSTVVSHPMRFGGGHSQPCIVQREALIERHRAHFMRFESAMRQLESITTKQERGQNPSESEAAFLGDIVEIQNAYGGRTYSGWYPNLFYVPFACDWQWQGQHPSDFWDVVITDVYTDVPCVVCGDPGTVLLEAIGTPQWMLIAVEHDQCYRSYAGPVYSHYEFTTGPGKIERRTDEWWADELRERRLPPQPEWTKDIIVPGAISGPFEYSWAP